MQHTDWTVRAAIHDDTPLSGWRWAHDADLDGAYCYGCGEQFERCEGGDPTKDLRDPRTPESAGCPADYPLVHNLNSACVVEINGSVSDTPHVITDKCCTVL